MAVLDPIGDLIVIIQDPNDEELETGIVLNPPNRVKKKTNAAERRRMRRRELFKDQKPDAILADNKIVHEDGLALEGDGETSLSTLGEGMNNLEELNLTRDVGRADIVEDNATQSANTLGPNKKDFLDPMQPDVTDEPKVAQFRISSSHLRLASSQFRHSLSSAYRGPKKEQFSLEDGTICDVLRTEQWDPNAFLILLRIVHGHNRQVPGSVNIDTLGKLAILVDYYECHERVELFARHWIEALKGDIPVAYGKTAILWLAVSWVFMEKSIFKRMTEIVLKHSSCPFEADMLPLPPILIGMCAFPEMFIH